MTKHSVKGVCCLVVGSLKHIGSALDYTVVLVRIDGLAWQADVVSVSTASSVVLVDNVLILKSLLVRALSEVVPSTTSRVVNQALRVLRVACVLGYHRLHSSLWGVLCR